MASNYRYPHWVPKAKPVKGFPFSYEHVSIAEAEAEEYLAANEPDIELNFNGHGDLKKMISIELMKVFPYHKYTDVYQEKYIGRDDNGKDVSFTVKVNVKGKETYTNRNGKESEREVVKKVWAIKLQNFYTDYQFNLVRSVEQLEEILSGDHEAMSFDLESTGLHPIEDRIVGSCLSFEPKVGYYVPHAHDDEFEEFNLGFDALDMIYDKMVRTPIVFMFNARFDMRLMEFCPRKYDMSKVYVIDTQVTTWYADADYKVHDLKSLEKHFIGYYRIDLEDTMGAYGVDGFNFGKLDPRNAVFYGAMDGISTFELGMATMRFHREFKISAQIDQKLLYVLMKYENEPIRVDMDLLESETPAIKERLDTIEKLIRDQVGDINLNSPQQKAALFKSYGLDTKVKTKTGKMSTAKDAVKSLVERLENRGEEVPEWLTYLNEQSKLSQLYSTFFNPLLVQAKMHDGEVRINYRNTVAATGRLSSGKEEL